MQRETGKRQWRACAVAIAVVGSVLWTGDARAEFDFQFAANMNGAWLRRTPALSARRVSTSARDIAAGDIQTRGGLALLGFSADLDLTLDDRWKVPLLGGAAYWAVGSYPTTITSYDGSIAHLRPWSTFRADLLLPGVGRRWKHRRNMWGAAIRTGISFATMGGTVAAGTETVPLTTLTAATFLVQVEFEACRRLDPTTRVCAQVVPRLYEHELLNGLTFGLRMEWGR